MSQTIDIQVTFDADSILKHDTTPSTNPNEPRSVNSKYVFMVVADDEAVSGNGGSTLTVKAETDDTIRWRETTPGVDYSTILYAFKATTGEELITTPQPVTSEVTVPLPNKDNLTEPGRQKIKDFFWNCIAQTPGNVIYHFNFMIVSRSGKIKGYYYWDPYINITDPTD